MLAVNRGGKPAELKTYFDRQKLPFTALRQKEDEVGQSYGVRGCPMNYLVSPDGKIAARLAGFPAAALRETLEKHLPGK